MSENTELRAFPKDEFEALAMLYLQNQDLSGCTPTYIYDKYLEALYEIRGEKALRRNNGYFNEKQNWLREIIK